MSDFNIVISADASKAVAAFSQTFGAANTAAQRMALTMSGAFAKVGKSSDEAVKSVQDYNKAMIAAGLSEKAAAAEALKYAQSLAKTAQTAQQSGGHIEDGGRRASFGLQMVGQQLSDVASQLSTGTNPFTILVQQGPQVAASLQMGGGAAAVMAQGMATLKAAMAGPIVALGTLGAALAVGAAAYRVYGQEADRIIEKRAFEKDVAESLRTSEEKLTDAYLAEAVAEGAITKELGKEIAYRQDAQRTVEAFARAQQTKIDGLNQEIEASKKWITIQHGVAAAAAIVFDVTLGMPATYARMAASGKSLNEVIAEDARSINGAIDSFTGLQSGTDDAKGKIDALNRTLLEEADNTSRTKDANIQAAKAAEATAEAKKAEAAARRDNAAATRAEKKAEGEKRKAEADQKKAEEARKAAAADLTKMIAGFNRGTQEAQRSMSLLNADPVVDAILKEKYALEDLTAQRAVDQDAIEMKHQAEEAAAAAEYEAGIRAGQKEADLLAKYRQQQQNADKQAQDALLAAEKSYQDQKSAIILQAQADRLEAQKQADEAQRAAAQKAYEVDVASYNSRFQLAASMAGALVDLTELVGKNMTEKQKKSAMALFAVQKIAGIAQAGLNVVMSVSNASTLQPYPVAIAAMIAAGVTGAATVAKVAAAPPPKFHKGTLAADEFHAVLQKKEAVIPADVMSRPGAKEQAAALVSGRSPVTSDEVAKGMDGSSIPGLLRQLSEGIDYVEKAVNLLGAKGGMDMQKLVQVQRQGRPGHKGAYAY